MLEWTQIRNWPAVGYESWMANVGQCSLRVTYDRETQKVGCCVKEWDSFRTLSAGEVDLISGSVSPDDAILVAEKLAEQACDMLAVSFLR